MISKVKKNHFLNKIAIILTIFNFCSTTAPASIPHSTQRQSFIENIAKQAQQVNQQIYNQRQYLLQLFQKARQGSTLSDSDKKWVQTLSQHYRVKAFSIQSKRSWQQLVNRVNILPLSMVVAQAINESSWGQSRFAKQGNNFFGMWCYTPGCGIVPKRRAPGKTFEVRSYPSIKASIEDYFLTLNRSRAYSYFRQQRALLEKNKQALSGLNLITHMQHYSEKGAVYTDIIKKIILHYHLDRFDQTQYQYG